MPELLDVVPVASSRTADWQNVVLQRFRRLLSYESLYSLLRRMRSYIK